MLRKHKKAQESVGKGNPVKAKTDKGGQIRANKSNEIGFY